MQRPQIGVVAKDGSEPVNEKYYTSGIQVTIQDMVASNVTTAKKLKYEILDKNGNNITAEASGGTSGESDVPSTTFDMLNDGIYTIRAKAVDAKGKESATRERQVVIDTANPTIPSLTVNGSKGPNAGDTTYISAISVAITPRNRYNKWRMGNRIRHPRNKQTKQTKRNKNKQNIHGNTNPSRNKHSICKNKRQRRTLLRTSKHRRTNKSNNIKWK